MNKPRWEKFDLFRAAFETVQEGQARRQYLLPYFLSGPPQLHGAGPGRACGLLAVYMRDNHLYTEPMQEFTPTPMSLSTTMYYAGLDPFTMEPVPVQRAGKNGSSGRRSTAGTGRTGRWSSRG